MTRSIELNFSHRFAGTIWNIVVSPQDDVMLIEVRSQEAKVVTFAALRPGTGEILWRDVQFDEPWWITLNGASSGVALFTIYTDTNNPDRKGLFGYDIAKQRIAWWQNDFSLTRIGRRSAEGIASKYGTRILSVDILTGVETNDPIEELQEQTLRPFQYTTETPHFDTVKTFLLQRFNFEAVSALEYLEHDALIMISGYHGGELLVNELVILSEEGDILLREKLDEQLKGIGLDTFFIYGGCVFFAKNKRELFSYKIV